MITRYGIRINIGTATAGTAALTLALRQCVVAAVVPRIDIVAVIHSRDTVTFSERRRVRRRGLLSRLR